MSHEEQNDWPSFETVLRDVAPDSPTARSLESADARARYAEKAAKVRSASSDTRDSLLSTPSSIESGTTSTATETTTRPTPEPAPSPSSRVSDFSADLPSPLEPIELDTSSIRALLNGGPTSTIDVDELEALAPLPDPVVEDLIIEDLVVEEPVAEDTEAEEAVEGEEALVEEPEVDDPVIDELVDEDSIIEEPVIEDIEEAPTAGDNDFFVSDESLVFELDDESISDIDAAFESDFEATPVELEDPHVDDPTDVSDVAFTHADVPSLEFAPESSVEAGLDPSLESPFEDLANPFDEIGAEPFEETTLDAPEVADERSTEAIDDSPAELEQAVDSSDLLWDDLDLGLPAETTGFSADETELTEDIELAEVEPEAQIIELPTDGFPDLSQDNDEQLPTFDEPTSFDSDFGSDLGTFDAPPVDLFDLTVDSASIEADRMKLDGLDSDDEGFDAVAAADAIETDLDSLTDLEPPEAESSLTPLDFPDGSDFDEQVSNENNVIALHPEAEEASAPATPASEGAPPRETSWMSLPPAPPDSSERADPWAYMRPSEEPKKKKGFWANRPRFFGGEDRRRARAKREQEDIAAIDESTGISFDKECPNCGDECQVDLDDPVGRRVHVSCPSCKHIWYTPYVIDDSQTG